MFEVRETKINGSEEKRTILDAEAGAVVVFEGRIRDHNEGREVERLEYQVYEELARNEFENIVHEAENQFDFIEASCVQFEGMLEVGETGIWIGVSAAHRKEAFQACQYLIDEIKKRLPIWKKEYYREGDSGWVNCP